MPAREAVRAEVRLYERLFTDPHPDAGGRDFLQSLNPQSMRVTVGYLEPSVADAAPDTRLQFERHGYFVPDRGGFNRTVTLRDSWAKP